MKPLCLLSLATLLLLTSTGCVPILIHAAVQSDAEQRTAYSAYCDSQAAINTQREIAGLEPLPVMSRIEWREAMRGAPLAEPLHWRNQ